MKIDRFKIANIKSIGKEISFSFGGDINILIGPNAGGKSNLMDIINMVLNEFFIWHFKETPPDDFGRILIQRENLEGGFFDLEKHFDHSEEKQKVEITFSITLTDRKNIKLLFENLDKIKIIEQELSKKQTNEIENVFRNQNPALLKRRKKITYSIFADTLDRNSLESLRQTFSEAEKLYLSYLNYFEKIDYLIKKYNTSVDDKNKIQELNGIVKYYSPYRFHGTGNLRISLPNQNLSDKKKQAKEKTSKTPSSDFEYFSTYLASKLRHCDDKEGRFNKDHEVRLIKKYLKDIGVYDFRVNCLNKPNNVYEIGILDGDRLISLKQASSGEKEFINLIFSIFTFHIENGLIIIDEPEAHLHPQWQRKLLRLLEEISKDREIQILMSTHSGVFVTPQTIKNIIRVYKEKTETKIIPAKRNRAWIKRLGEQKHLLRVINTTNNERVFFSNKIVLVEGLTDRVVFSEIIKATNKNDINIDVVDVGGKEEYRRYMNLLKQFKIGCYVICDLDNLWAGSLLKGDANTRPIREEINKFSKGLDHKALLRFFKKSTKKKITKIDIAKKLFVIIEKIYRSDFKNITKDEVNFIRYWRDKCLDKKKIYEEQIIKNKAIDQKAIIDSLKNRVVPIYVLQEGSIEDYTGFTHNTKGAIKFLEEVKREKINFIANFGKRSKYKELSKIVSLILSEN